MRTVIVDYDSGNLHSAEKSFQRVAGETGGGEVLVSSRPEVVARADRVVLPGVGAFADCRRVLAEHTGLFEAVEQRVIAEGAPFLGICVGMQMMATWGREHVDTRGFGWIGGEVVRIRPADAGLKVPHMGWNNTVIEKDSPLFEGISREAMYYFVHSYHVVCNNENDVLTTTDYGYNFHSSFAHGKILGVQFHPEKSHKFGMLLLKNFIENC